MEHEKKPHNGPSATQEKAPEKKHEHAQGPSGDGAGQKPAQKKPDEQPDMAQTDVEQAFSALSERLLRLSAEFDNYKKRTAKEKEAIASQSEARLMIRLLPAYEEAGLAMKEVEKMQDAATRKGVMMVLGNLRASFEKEGLQPMKLENEPLDPFRHEVALREESVLPEGTIVRVIKHGYLYKGAVLQHAIVSVSTGKKEEADEKKNETQEVGE